MPPGAPRQVVPGMWLGSYEVLMGIARGGMAQVWAARQHGARGFNRLVALKTVLPELATPELEAMFLEEARLAARVHHPNVCEIFELVEDAGVLALAMEWMDGDTLNAVLEASPACLESRVAAQIVAHMASGLHAAHELCDEFGVPLELVHRDVSPHNVLISRGGHVKVTDFGVAKAMAGAREPTLGGSVKGKPSYMSPEQVRCAPLDRRSDVFSLGVVLYVATVGVNPFRKHGQCKQRQLMNLLDNEVTPPSDIAPCYPKALESIVLKAIAHEPIDRFSTADEMRRALCEWILETGGPVTEGEISRVVLERVGHAIERRAEQIAGCVRASRDRRGASAVVFALEPRASARADTTVLGEGKLLFHEAVVETSFASTAKCEPRSRWRSSRRVLLAVACCGALGGLGLYRASLPEAQLSAAAEAPAAPELAPASATTTKAEASSERVEPASAGPTTTLERAATPQKSPSTQKSASVSRDPPRSATVASKARGARDARLAPSPSRARGLAKVPPAAASRPQPLGQRTPPSRKAAAPRIGPREMEL